jgi:hypothetical protein
MSTHATPDVIELVREAQKQTLATLEQFQQVSLKAAEAAAAFVPAEPWPGFSNTLPTPTELVEATFGFYGKMLESQKAYARRLADVAAKTAESTADGAKKTAR